MHKWPKNVQQNSTQNNEIYGSQWTNLKRLLESDLIVLELSFLSSNPPNLFSCSPSQTLSKFPFPHLSLSHVSVPPKSANLASFSHKPLPTPLLLIQEDVITFNNPHGQPCFLLHVHEAWLLQEEVPPLQKKIFNSYPSGPEIPFDANYKSNDNNIKKLGLGLQKGVYTYLKSNFKLILLLLTLFYIKIK